MIEHQLVRILRKMNKFGVFVIVCGIAISNAHPFNSEENNVRNRIIFLSKKTSGSKSFQTFDVSLMKRTTKQLNCVGGIINLFNEYTKIYKIAKHRKLTISRLVWIYQVHLSRNLITFVT